MKNQTLPLLFFLLTFLSVPIFAQPSNDNVCDATFVSIGNSTALNIHMASVEIGEDLLTPPLDSDKCNTPDFWCDDGINASVWFRFIGPSSRAVKISLCNSNVNTQLAVFEVGDCTDFSTFKRILANDDPISLQTSCSLMDSHNNLNAELELACLTPGREYFALVDIWNDGPTTAISTVNFILDELSMSNGVMQISNILTLTPTCPGEMNGRATAVLSNPVFPIEVLWNTGETELEIAGLSGGQSVSITVTDFCGTVQSSATQIPFPSNPTGPLILEELTVLPAFCGSGYASLSISGGKGPYNIRWSSGDEGSFAWLDKGSYTCTITDLCNTDSIIIPSFIVEGGADAGPDQILNCGSTILGNSNTSAGITTDNSIGYTFDPTIGPGIACRSSTFISENGVLRTFDLATDFGITTPYKVDAIEIGIESSLPDQVDSSGNFNPQLGTMPLEIRLFEINTTNLTAAGLLPVDTVRVSIPRIETPMLFRIPIDYTIAPNQLIAVEIWHPNGREQGHQLSIGANEGGTLNNVRTWIRSEDCGLLEPMTLVDIGFEHETIVNLVQQQPYSGSYVYQWSPIIGLSDPTSPTPVVTLPSNSGTVVYTLEVTDDSGCVSLSTVNVDASFSGDFEGIAGTTIGGGEACYQGFISANTDTPSIVPAGGILGYVLTQGSDFQVVAFNDNPSFDFSTIDFSSLGIPDCGLFTVHTFVYSIGTYLPALIGRSGAELLQMIADESLCASIDSMGTPFQVICVSPGMDLQINTEACGMANGTVTAMGSNGMPPYTFNWSDGQTGSSLSNLTAGNYTVTLSDGRGCTSVRVFEMENANGLSAISNTINSTCFQAHNGQIQLSTTGGNPPLTFLWSNGATTKDVSNLAPDVYAVTVTDADDCSYVIADLITTQPEVLNLALDLAINLTCEDAANGQIYTTPSGGTPPYTFAWNNGASQEDLANLDSGVYTVTLTDSQACSFSTTVAILTEPNSFFINTETVNDISCNGNFDGFIQLQLSGGTLPFTYSWNNGSTSESLNNVLAGIYVVTITDANGCFIVSDPYTITEPEELNITLSNAINPSCIGEEDGSISVEVVGGVMPYRFLWSNGATTSQINNLAPIFYSVTVTDANDCVVNFFNIGLSDPSPFQITALITDASSSTASDGSIELSLTGGTSPYTYTWDNGQTGDNLLENLPSGTYCVTINDANDCIFNYCDNVGFATSIDPIPSLDVFTLSPNPAKDKVILDLVLTNNERVVIQVLNTLGQVVEQRLEENWQAGQMQFDVSQYSTGLYFVKIKIEEHMAIQRMIVQQ